MSEKPLTEVTIVQLTADAILQNPIKVTVCGREYSVAPPSTATLIEASKYIAEIPQVNIDESDNILSSVLSVAADCSYVGDIVAILMLGKKHLVDEKKYLFGMIKRRVDNVSKLSRVLLENLTPEELNGLVAQILKTLRVDFFFGTLTFLQGINQIRTKSRTTASGQPSQE
jgi:hypothetical protein